MVVENNMARACGNEECSTSTGITDDLTFGSGRLTTHGFWEFPCKPCARAWEERNPGKQAWPFPDLNVEAITISIKEELAEEAKDNLFFDCWLDG